MPCTKVFEVDTSKPVLVTGATGYVAGVLVQQLLNHGLTVHATVRDPSKKDRIQYLQDLADKSTKRGKIKFFKGDLLQPGSFDEAAQGCAIIFHTASPYVYDVADPYKDIVEPAVKGTENVLTTANHTPTVKRVVVTSSVVAMYGNVTDAKSGVFSEEDWNRSSSLTELPYGLSKTLAEQKAWVMAGSQLQWKLVVVNPSAVFGPGVIYHESAESFKLLKQFGDGTMKAGAPHIPMGIVDVRDVAAAHLAAAFLPNAHGRYIVSGHNSNLPAMGQALAARYPPPKYPVPTKTLPLPKFLVWLLAPFIGLTRSFVENNLNYHITLDNTKAKKELGMEFMPMEILLQEMFQQLLDNGGLVK